MRSKSWISAVVIALVAWGCGGAKETSRGGAPAPTMKEFLAASERSFQPSHYDPPMETLQVDHRAYESDHIPADLPVPAAAETIPGFRVQVLLTQDIDQATSTRQTLAQDLPEEWVYLAFDLPYYKVRVGNYADRESANQAVRRLVSLGYPDAWVVPDKILRNPPLPPVPAPPDSSGR